MSHFDFPRFNFHGTALLDTATANNGNFEGKGLTMFDQDNSVAFLPPRCYLPPNYTYNPPVGVKILQDAKGKSFVPILPVTADNYQEWAVTPLGHFGPDSAYYTLYDYLGLTNNTPGYWNYFGDLSMSLLDTLITGVTLPDQNLASVTYTSGDQPGCPEDIKDIFGSEFSFNSDYFSPGSLTSAYLCDIDSIGQMCTQVFCGTAGLYKTESSGNQVTWFSGKPAKSTARYMNLNKVLNYADPSLIPMAGSAVFYAKIEISGDSQLATLMTKYAGKSVRALFLKLMIHEVYEVRSPDYSSIRERGINDLFGNKSFVKKNPAKTAISGSITPYFEGDMITTSVSRMLVGNTSIPITSQIPKPKTKSNTYLSVASNVTLSPVPFYFNENSQILSIDLLNSINEFGSNPGSIPPYAGSTDVYPFTTFESYNYGQIQLCFQPDSGGSASVVKSFTFEADYNMYNLLATGGVIDINVGNTTNYTSGSFFMTINGSTVLYETDHLITSDQMGNYAQQNQPDFNYMSDGLPRIPCTLRVFRRGKPIPEGTKITVTQQNIDLRSGSVVNVDNVSIYDQQPMPFPVDKDGCLTYVFIDKSGTPLSPDFSNLFTFIMNNSLIVVRTLESKPVLKPYLDGTLPVTWEVVFDNIFALFKTLYPVMDKILPFTEANWSNSFILSKMINLIDDANWNQPLYMPVTRDLSFEQQQLLRIWAKQNTSDNHQVQSSPINKDILQKLLKKDFNQKYPLSIVAEKAGFDFNLPPLQSFAYGVYKNYWVFIGGEKAGFHGTSNNPPPFLTDFANTEIHVLDSYSLQYYSIPIPEQLLLNLAVTNPQFYQVGNILYFCGGYAVSDKDQPIFNITSDFITAISLPDLINFVINGGKGIPLSNIFLFGIHDEFVKVTGGAMMVVNDIFYIIGGQDFEGKYSPGASGNYTDSVRSFTILKSNIGWSINNKSSVTDHENLHRRDFNLVPFVNENNTLDCILYGGVFTPDGLSYNHPVYISGLASGQVTINTGEFTQLCNQYTCSTINFMISPGSGMIYTLLGGISYMKYDEALQQLVIGDNGIPMPFSNIIDFLVTDGQNTEEYVQLPPNALLPGYIGSNSCFIPNTILLARGSTDIIDLNKVFAINSDKILLGFLYGGILSDGPTSGTTAHGHVNTYASNNVYNVYLIADTDSK